MDLIKHLAQTKATFLHPLGEESTDLLLQQLVLKKGDKVLEIGCGNGATAQKILKKTEVDYYAVEKSEEMLRSVQNLTITSEKSLRLIKEQKLPFDDCFFDVIIAESVLAIIEGEALSIMVEEIYRVLKPSGIFIVNDAIWKTTTSKTLISKINSLSKANFNIIQANEIFCDKNDWINLYKDKGFRNIESIKLQPKSNTKKMISSFNIKKINVLVRQPKVFVNELNYKLAIKKMYDFGKHIEAYIFKMAK